MEQFADTMLHDRSISSVLSSLGIFIIDEHSEELSHHPIWKHLGRGRGYDQSWLERIHPEDRKRVEANVQEMIDGKRDSVNEVFRYCLEDGSWRWVAHRGGVAYRDEGGSPWLFFGVDEDITKIKEAQEEASIRAREAATLQACIEVVSSSLDLEETVGRVLEQARRVVAYDRASVQVLHDGYLEVLGSMGYRDSSKITGFRFPFPQEGSLSTRAIQERRPCLSNDVAKEFPNYIHMEREEPASSWIGVPLIAHGDVIGFISFEQTRPNGFTHHHLEMVRGFAGPVAIAMENARMHGETYRLAMEDALTEVGSRHSFDLNGRYLFEKARREEQPITFALLDLDHFKRVNDDFGHQIGDQVLHSVAQTCQKNVRASDVVARYGGEEIAILFPDTDVKTAMEIARRIRQDVRSITLDGVNRPITVSIGVAGGIPGREVPLSDMVRDADAALYRAKSLGRDRVVVFAHESFPQ